MSKVGLYVTGERDGARAAIKKVDMPQTDGATIRKMVDGYMEVAARGDIAGVPCVLICDEEGRVRADRFINWAAADLATTMTQNPQWLFMGIYGDCVLLRDGEEDWRAFTGEEVSTVLAQLYDGGFNVLDDELRV
jgi:hypothetical protein